jgi:hypothetical protein
LLFEKNIGGGYRLSVSGKENYFDMFAVRGAGASDGFFLLQINADCVFSK